MSNRINYPPTKHIANPILRFTSGSRTLKNKYDVAAHTHASTIHGVKARIGTVPFNFRNCLGLSSNPALVRMIVNAIILKNDMIMFRYSAIAFNI